MLQPITSERWTSVNRAEVQWSLIIGLDSHGHVEVDRSGPLDYNMSLTLSMLLSTLFLGFSLFLLVCFFTLLIVAFHCSFSCVFLGETCCVDTF